MYFQNIYYYLTQFRTHTTLAINQWPLVCAVVQEMFK